MLYYSEEDINKVIPIYYKRQLLTRATPINVRFCRDCPCFEEDYWQEDPSVVNGWCTRLSYYKTLDDEIPYYVNVNSNSFCNKDDIKEEDV